MPIFLRPAELHIPDGFLNVTISILFWLIAIIMLGIAVRRTQDEFSERQIPLMGVMAAFIFAAQMINFPVAGGTSGHMLGGALAAIALGPWAGMLVMVAVIAVQALLFQDGGLLVLGANIFNMGLVTAAIGYGLYRAAAGRGQTTRLAVAGVAAWLSVMAGAFFTSLQLWLSNTSAAAIVFPAMLGVHALIGTGEALITVATLAFIFRTRPDVISHTEETRAGKGWVVAGLAISLLVVLLSPFASTDPDGLERVAINLGFIKATSAASYQILPDYTVPFLGKSGLSTILAGVVGILVVLVLAWGVVLLTRRETS